MAMAKLSGKGGGRKERITPPKTKLLSLGRGRSCAEEIRLLLVFWLKKRSQFARASERANRSGSVSSITAQQSADTR
jgi:hypothetical protein